MKICFIMYPWEKIDPKQDSSLRIIHECVKRGHHVSLTTPSNLTIRDSLTMSFCKTFEKGKVTNNMISFYDKSKFQTELLSLRDFDVIFMRANPPLDPLVLNFLDSIKDDVFIINNINGLREANNKIYTASYYDPERELIPATHVSKNIDYLMRVIKESDADKMILKPLDGYGGSGVIVIEKSAMQNVKSLLDFYVNRDRGVSNYVILQDYVEGAEKGDVRVLMLNGKPIGALRRVPSASDVRSNISAGGTAEKYKLTKADKILCDKVGEKLVRDGILYAGLDIIGGKLIEVNVLSPGTIKDINKLNGVKLQEKIVDYLEEVVKTRGEKE
ncbi:MAG: glutathione synthase [Salibacteraceae bacterium]|jgi:glutathione synthase|nr:glutathione synthase [Salibacteraceae bacterium]MDP4687432.1 glutathione synthase [Salibacteraceae bacterium]MDP4763653.1 glutathione synthase [Salibacteraceae bacterium]MDP4844093.1 glutathione synthase [Salibacteraceae bacterium]MDP4934302.1 glutathione synthase [Salibacteraceae bacterium]